LRTVTKTYKDGETIYRQGEDSQWAFEVLEGSVELIKDGPEGVTVMARLKTGELFGELGILDNTPRSTTARARGGVTVKAIPRDEFLRQVEADPDTALKVMTKLARRMRSPEGGDNVRAAAYKAAAANLPAVVPSESLPTSPLPVRLGRPLPVNLIGERKPNFMEKIFDAVAKDPTRRPGRKAKNPPPADILILVGKLRDDYEDIQHKLLLQALDGIPGVRAASLDRDLTTIAYRLKGKTTYALEGSIFNAGTVIQWLRDGAKMIENAAESERLAVELDDHGSTGRVYFVPAFTGLGASHWDAGARGAILGLTRDSSIGHIVRAGLESVCYQTHDLLTALRQDGIAALPALRVDGGMIANNWLLQFLADITGIPVERPVYTETTVLGAAFLADLGQGLFSSLDEIRSAWRLDFRATPKMPDSQRDALLDGWQDAVKRVMR